jgi:OmpA-OmpF porin, OOP family
VIRKRGAYLAALAIAAATSLSAEGSASSRLVLVERSDFSRYRDGKYLGHAYREARCSLEPKGSLYSGEAIVFEETLRDQRLSSRRVERSSRVELELLRGGGLELARGSAPGSDSGFPDLRGLPTFPRDPATGELVEVSSLEGGATWTAPGSRVLDFDDSGAIAILPFLAEYRLAGASEYRGVAALNLKAKFATRWRAASSGAAAIGPGAASGPRPVSAIVSSATGTHELDIVVDAVSLAPLFIRDRFDESFVLVGGGAAGGTERRSGFCLYFFEGGEGIDRRAAGAAIAAAVAGRSESPGPALGGARGNADSAAGERLPPGAGPGALDAGEGPALDEALGELNKDGALGRSGLELDTSPEGLVLRLKDLRFVADSDELLPSEKSRLDAVAAALKALGGRSFLVAGHSASVGKDSGELELSIRRAKKVTDELVLRGIEASRLLYRGFGSTKPLAPNDSEGGRAKNRRVEITILD